MSIKLAEDQVTFRRHSYPPNAEINVTPFVDVMLVLLVIFMIVAPLATVTVPVTLPRSSAAATPTPLAPVTVTVQTDGTIYVGNTKTDEKHLIAALLVATKSDLGTRIFLRGDKHLEYGQLMQVMDELSDGGFSMIGLVSQQTGTP
jgi:biopolymer transport protein ExbD/biopolymer transport protein TolR